jgi:hypothetical protein
MPYVDYILSSYAELFPGIQRAIGTSDWSFESSSAAGWVPRKQYVNVFRIDLSSPLIRIVASQSGETGLYTVPEFASQKFTAGMLAMVAWNGNYFDMASPSTIYGLAVSAGEVVNLPLSTDQPLCPWSLVISEQPPPAGPGFQGTVQNVQSGGPLPLNMWVAVSGDEQIVAGGQNVATDQGPPVAARTVAGVSQDGATLFMATIDGMETAAEPYGGSIIDAAQWLILAGAWAGINLDGGGSATVARIAAGQGPATLMNMPYGNENIAGKNNIPGAERTVGLCFGVAVMKP